MNILYYEGAIYRYAAIPGTEQQRGDGEPEAVPDGDEGVGPLVGG